MAGGGREARRQARPLLETMAATVRGELCVSLFESAAAAHFVQMVHVGIECALLQLLSETFDLLQRALLLTEAELNDVAGAWHLGILNGYLVEISGRVLNPANQHAPRLVLREELKLARSSPQGRWLAHSSWDLEVPMPTIEAAVEIQRVTASERRQALADTPFRHPVRRVADDRESVLDEMHGALHAATVITYAQGMALLSAASQHLGFRFNLHEISRAWRGCARLRTALLEDITTALEATPELPGLLTDDNLSQRVMACQENLRRAVWRAHQLDASVPALIASLDYLDFNRAAWLPVNLIQASRCQPARRAAFPAGSC
jgi:6-phosphogluconate dehydrogenase